MRLNSLGEPAVVGFDLQGSVLPTPVLVAFIGLFGASAPCEDLLGRSGCARVALEVLLKGGTNDRSSRLLRVLCQHLIEHLSMPVAKAKGQSAGCEAFRFLARTCHRATT